MLKDKYENVIVEREDGITWVTLNRPEKRNALSPALHYEMAEIIDELEVDPDTGETVQLTDCNFDARCAELPPPRGGKGPQAR